MSVDVVAAMPANLWDLPTSELPPILLRPEEAARVLTVSRWKVFELIRLGELRSVQDGRLDLIEMGDLAEERFRQLHPEVDEEAVRALGWCYTWDYK